MWTCAYDRILRVARTIADLAASSATARQHEAQPNSPSPTATSTAPPGAPPWDKSPCDKPAPRLAKGLSQVKNIKKTRGCEAFGEIDGDARIAPGQPGCARIKETDLGKIIAKTILHFPYEFPIIKVLQFCVMPDHVHILLQVLYRSDRHLDFYIETLKQQIANKFGKSSDDIFEEGYCDKPLYDNRSLDGLFRYIRENPHRLAMRHIRNSSSRRAAFKSANDTTRPTATCSCSETPTRKP